MRIFLIGYMGSGKTNTGNKLAEKLGLVFRDLDYLFEAKYRISIYQFFSKYGEELFRELEHKLLKESVVLENMVLSVGGGTPFFYDNMQIMNDHGLTVYIKMPPDALYTRLTNSRKQRPLINDLEDSDLREHIHKQLILREEYYNKARIIVDGLNLDLDRLAGLILSDGGGPS